MVFITSKVDLLKLPVFSCKFLPLVLSATLLLPYEFKQAQFYKNVHPA
jgi:hypothetical protein